MTRINSNVSSLIAQSNLQKSSNDLQTHLQRLSTGLRINRGSDDPAGLIISDRLGSEINGLQQAVQNSQQASSVISTGEGALSEVSDLLNSIKGLVVEAANTGAVSDEERAANQLQIDSAIDSITRISNSTSFGGLNLLNGSLDYITSGLKSSAIAKSTIHNAVFGDQSSIAVTVDTVASAQTARLFLRGDYTGGPAGQGPAGPGRLQSSTTLEIAGPRGVQTVDFLQSAALSAVVAAVNSFRESTGVSASLVNGNVNSGVVFSSLDYGSNQFVSVKRLGGPSDGGYFDTYSFANNASVPTSINIPSLLTAGTLISANRDSGRDVFAVVNGTLASGHGTNISIANASQLSLDLTLSTAFATKVGSTTTYNITGGGALYQLGGEINSNQQLNISLPSIAASRIGGTLVNGQLAFLSSLKSGGTNDLNSQNFQSATDILSTAIDEISTLRGRLGALEKNTLDTNVSSLQTAIENLTSSQSVIKDADFAQETSALTRAQVLNSAGISVLQLANSQSQNVLALLKGG